MLFYNENKMSKHDDFKREQAKNIMAYSNGDIDAGEAYEKST